MVNSKEPEPQFVISAPGGNLNSALGNTDFMGKI
jgi:hypothetical protein